MDMDVLVESGMIYDHFLLHNKFREIILESWYENRWPLLLGILTGNWRNHMQPISLIK